MRTTLLSRLLAVTTMLLLAMTGLPATAQDGEVTEEDGSSTVLEEELDVGDLDDSDDESDDERGPRGERPNRGGAHLATGEVTGHLAPAIADVDQQVVVHAVARIHGAPGRPDHASPPDHVGTPGGSGRPDHAGPPDHAGANERPGQDDDADADDADDAAEDSGADDAEQDDVTDETVQNAPENTTFDEEQVALEDDESSSSTEEGGDDTEQADHTEQADDTEAADEADDTGDADDDAAAATEVEELDDEVDSDHDYKCVPVAPGAEFTEDDAEVEAEDDELDDSSADAPCDVTFTVDYGDQSPVQVMRPTKTRGRDGTRRALTSHAYAAEGAYEVVVTAYPLDGEPASFTMVAQVGGGTARLEGDSRIETAISISQDMFPDGSAQTVLIARADQFADALAASTLAFIQEGPVLLSDSDQVPEEVLDEVYRVLAPGGTVVLLGGAGALSEDVETDVMALGYAVLRLAGDDRIGTALAIADHLLDGGLVPSEIVIASAEEFPDALAGSAYAAGNGGLVLLTGGSDLDGRVGDLITERIGTITPVLIVGGELAISDTVATALGALGTTVERVSGADRYETSALLAARGYDGGDTVVLATGDNYPDALAGAAYAAYHGAPVLLVGETLPVAAGNFLLANAATIDRLVVLGGEVAVPDAVVAEAEALIAAPATATEEATTETESTETESTETDGATDDVGDATTDDTADTGSGDPED